MERTLEDQVYGVRPYIHKILVVTSPCSWSVLLRTRSMESVRTFTKFSSSSSHSSAGLTHMISTIHPDIDHADEYIHNTTRTTTSILAYSQNYSQKHM